MARQERTARATRKAAQQASTIIEKATEAARLGAARDAGVPVKRCPVCKATGTIAELKAGGHGKACTSTPASAPQTDAKARTKVTAGARVRVRPDNHSSDLGAQCVEMRNNGSSWMAIGAALGLPGAKSGAAAARKLYAAHTGESHKSAPGITRAPRASKRHAAQVGSKTSRREVVQRQGGFFSDDMSDDDIVALVHGKTIEWSIDLRRLAGGVGEPEWCDQDARVHPTDVYVREDNGERVLNFRTLEGWDEPDKFGNSAPIAGPTRTVRLTAIHTVR